MNQNLQHFCFQPFVLNFSFEILASKRLIRPKINMKEDIKNIENNHTILNNTRNTVSGSLETTLKVSILCVCFLFQYYYMYIHTDTFRVLWFLENIIFIKFSVS